MKTVIIGSGAMGSLFGGLLTLSGEEVWLTARRSEYVKAIEKNGLIIEEKGNVQNINVNITTDLSSIGGVDLVLLFVKTYQTEKALQDSLPLRGEKTIFLTLQNGLGNEELISKYIDKKNILLGITGHGATLIKPGQIRHAGWGKTFIGELDGKITNRINQIANMFRKAGIETEVSTNIHNLIWEKLLINVGINALTALTGLKNGQLLDYQETLRLMEGLVSEAVEVARSKGILIKGNMIENVKAVAEITRENRSSMGQDFDYRRKTEIDAINGAIVREAKKLGISVPFNQVITDLVKVIEKCF